MRRSAVVPGAVLVIVAVLVDLSICDVARAARIQGGSVVRSAPNATGTTFCDAIPQGEVEAALGVELDASASLELCQWSSTDPARAVGGDAALYPGDSTFEDQMPADQRIELDGWVGSVEAYPLSAALTISDGARTLLVNAFHDDPAVDMRVAATLMAEAVLGSTPTQSPAATPDPGMVFAPETTDDLILADIEAGVLDEPTGLLYRVYAAFGDARLPLQYLALEPAAPHGILDEAQRRFDGLPSEIQEELLPFLVRPNDPRSAFHGPAAASATITVNSDVAAAVGSCRADGWSRVASSAVPVVVWAACGDPIAVAMQTDAMAAVETLYPAEVALMGPPLPDRGGPEQGGDTAIDIYLVNPCVTRGVECLQFARGSNGAAWPDAAYQAPGGATESSNFTLQSSGFIGLHARRISSSADLRSTLAHELFHLLEYAHNRIGLMEERDDGTSRSHWFAEASAVWAEHHFVPDARTPYVYPHFGNFQKTPKGLRNAGGVNPYASWVWPLFMEQELGATSIGNAWRAMEGKATWNELDAAISSVLPYDTEFKEFAVRAWNGDLPSSGGGDAIKPRFQVLDRSMPETLPGGAKRTQLGRLLGAPDGTAAQVFVDGLPPLGVRYRQFDVDSSVQQLVVDFSGLQPADALDVEALLHLDGRGWERRPLPDGKTTFCRNDPGDDFDQLILVLADHRYDALVGGSYTIDPKVEPCQGDRLRLQLEGRNTADPGNTIEVAVTRVDMDLVAPLGIDKHNVRGDGGRISIEVTWTGDCQGSQRFQAFIPPQDGAFAPFEDLDGDVGISAGNVGAADGPQAFGEQIVVSVRSSQRVTLTCGYGNEFPFEDPYQGYGAASCGLVLKRTSPTTFEGRCTTSQIMGSFTAEWHGVAVLLPPDP